MSKVRNLKTGQDEDPSLTRVNSLLPSIANSQSLHNKAEVFASQISTGLMAVGLGLSRKKFRSLDGYLVFLTFLFLYPLILFAKIRYICNTILKIKGLILKIYHNLAIVGYKVLS